MLTRYITGIENRFPNIQYRPTPAGTKKSKIHRKCNHEYSHSPAGKNSLLNLQNIYLVLHNAHYQGAETMRESGIRTNRLRAKPGTADKSKPKKFISTARIFSII